MKEKWINVLIPNACDYIELKSWLKENVKEKYHIKPNCFDLLIGMEHSSINKVCRYI